MGGPDRSSRAAAEANRPANVMGGGNRPQRADGRGHQR